MNNQESTVLAPECKYKVVFLGDSGVGKTSIVQQIVQARFHDSHQATVILDTMKKNVIHNNRMRKLLLWDTAGQEKFNSLVPSALRNSDCIVLVFDIMSEASLQNCQKWMEMVTSNAASSLRSVVLVANKLDIPNKSSHSGAGFDYAIKNSYSYVEVSAKTGQGIQNLVHEIVESIERSSNSEKETCSSEGLTSKKIAINFDKKMTFRSQKVFTCCSI